MSLQEFVLLGLFVCPLMVFVWVITIGVSIRLVRYITGEEGK